jgi:thiamine transporter
MKNNIKAKALTESAIMIAFATVLSIIKLADMPYGGSVTIASALPIAIIAYRYGIKTGLLAGTVHAVIQQLIGISTLSYFTTWQSILAIIVLDYMVAFAASGLAGIFRKVIKNQALALSLGCALICIIRYACHVISGATVWAGLSIPTEAALSYSFIYNATYMIPETIILIIVSLYIGSAIDFRAAMPTRLVKQALPSNISWIRPVAGLLSCAAVVYDVAKIFEQLQDAGSGEFNITGIINVDWVELIVMNAVIAIVVICLLIVRRSPLKPNETK